MASDESNKVAASSTLQCAQGSRTGMGAGQLPANAADAPVAVALCWPFPPGSQNHTDKAVKLKPYVPPKRRSLNQY